MIFNSEMYTARVAAYLLLLQVSTICGLRNSKALVVSLDGFRWDYVELAKGAGKPMKHFTSLSERGTTIRYGGMKNVYPTITCVNHLTMGTGLFAESHGIVSNVFWDPNLNDTFSCFNETKVKDGKWFRGLEPVWKLNENQGGKTVCYNWFGCMSDGMRPTYGTKVYNRSVPFLSRIDDVVHYLAREDVNLGFLYFEDPDSTGHKFGPASAQMWDVLESLDGDLGYILDQLAAKGLLDSVDLLITADHGMAQVNAKDVIYLTDKVRYLATKFVYQPGAFLMAQPIGDGEELYRELKKIPHVEVYRKARGEIPPDYHFSNNARILPLLITAQYGYAVYSDSARDPSLGDHGYNNSIPNMHPIFIGAGPSFRSGAVVEELHSVDLYPLLCRILGLKPGAHNGSEERVTAVLHHIHSAGSSHHSRLYYTATVTGVALLLLLSCACVCVGLCRQRAWGSSSSRVRRHDPSPAQRLLANAEDLFSISEDDELN